ncbi:MAG: SprT family zinc-dependent metalloprotease [Cyanobacteriota bacterium]|nr:SprT family zinc-dependent metalloprotease [Cyanobacteriota bacterium]
MSAIPPELLGLRVEVVRSPRRTAALHIVGSELQVRVPAQLGDDRVAALLQHKRPWIRSKVAQLQQLPPPPRQPELVSGESFPYLGRHYRLKVREGNAVGVCLCGGILRATVRPREQGDLRHARLCLYLERWYRARALERLREKTDRYARQMGVTPAGMSVRAFRSRWGSCDNQGQLVFNWHIIKAPHPVVDYVVIHELAHLMHPNHSKAFWRLVEHHCPAFALHRTWLKDHSLRLL